MHNGYVEIISETQAYKHSILLDIEDLAKVGKVRITNKGYAYTCVGGHSVANLVMKHDSNMKTVVDHINGNKLDNRKSKLRVVTQRENSTNKSSFIRNNTGTIGISYRENGSYKYYRVSLTDTRTVKDSNEQGVRFSKQFNINKLGKEEAFRQAKEILFSKKQEFNYLP